MTDDLSPIGRGADYMAGVGAFRQPKGVVFDADYLQAAIDAGRIKPAPPSDVQGSCSCDLRDGEWSSAGWHLYPDPEGGHPIAFERCPRYMAAAKWKPLEGRSREEWWKVQVSKTSSRRSLADDVAATYGGRR